MNQTTEAASYEDYGNYSYDDLEYEGFEGMEGDYTPKETLHIISVVIYSVSFVLGLAGNGVVIWVTGFKSTRTVNNIWLLNLAIADFVFVFFLPLSIHYVLQDFNWSFGWAMCKVNSFVSVMNMYASVLFLMVLSIDRYVALVHLSWCQKWRTVGRACIVCVVIWAMSATLSLPTLIFRDITVQHKKVVCFNNYHDHDSHTMMMRHIAMVAIRTTVGFLLPLCTISVTGVLLAVKVQTSEKSIRLSTFSKMVSLVILVFFLCWAPFHTLSLMELTIHSSTHLHSVLRTGFPLATSLAFFNSCLNPLLYVLVVKKVRRILRRSFLDITKRSLRELNQSLSVTESVTVAEGNPPDEPTELSVFQADSPQALCPNQ